MGPHVLWHRDVASNVGDYKDAMSHGGSFNVSCDNMGKRLLMARSTWASE